MMSSSKGQEGTGEHEWSNLKKRLLARISDVHGAGWFATYRYIENFLPSGISVDGVGELRLPLSSHDADSLIKPSRKTPFKEGEQSVVYETERKTLEIDGSKIFFANEGWHGWLENIVQSVSKDLGVTGGSGRVQAKLDKMLLYEKDATFNLHIE